MTLWKTLKVKNFLHINCNGTKANRKLLCRRKTRMNTPIPGELVKTSHSEHWGWLDWLGLGEDGDWVEKRLIALPVAEWCQKGLRRGRILVRTRSCPQSQKAHQGLWWWKDCNSASLLNCILEGNFWALSCSWWQTSALSWCL